MRYLARRLHLPSGELLERYEVLVDDGRVLQWQPFESECQSMLLVDELFVREEGGGELVVGGIRL